MKKCEHKKTAMLNKDNVIVEVTSDCSLIICLKCDKILPSPYNSSYYNKYYDKNK